MPILDITLSRPSSTAWMKFACAFSWSTGSSPASARARSVSSARYGFTAEAP